MVQRLYLLLACLCCSLSAAERVINACDSTTQWTTSNSATVTATTRGTSSAVSIAIPANTSNGPGSATGVGEAILHSGSPFYPAGATDTYDGIRFWVKGNGTTKWGNIQLRFGDNWSRAWALFPVTTSWTEVTIPWREFYQQNYEGTMDNHYKTIFRLVFTSGFNQRDGHPLRNIPAHGYDIDDIRFVSGITLPPTPPITGLSIKNTMAKLQSGQPVKIVVMGASISWGLKLSSPATEAWPYKLEQLLRARYGNGVSVVNAAIPGFNSFEGGCALGWFANDREPVDLIMAADWCYNDYPDAEFVTGGVGEIANNYRNFFEQVLRRGNSEVLHVQSGLHCEPGNFDYMDAANTALSNLCDAMNVYKADVYGNFKAKGQPWLTANYYTFSGDYGHYNADAHAAAAQIVMDSIIAAERFTLTVVNGNGGGSYASAATVTISANAPPAGQIFDRW
ncbi:MAG TPA: hypothetical protein VEJ63_14205, partial [Planctomycetota bacterium]|nr:hypothetical protein [Planctomycetota bacterium]